MVLEELRDLRRQLVARPEAATRTELSTTPSSTAAPATDAPGPESERNREAASLWWFGVQGSSEDNAGSFAGDADIRRRGMIVQAIQYLELDPTSYALLAKAAGDAALERHDACYDEDAEIGNLYEEYGFDRETKADWVYTAGDALEAQVEENERVIRRRCRDRRQAALAPFHALLNGSFRHWIFRQKLEAWLDRYVE